MGINSAFKGLILERKKFLYYSRFRLCATDDDFYKKFHLKFQVRMGNLVSLLRFLLDLRSYAV